MERVSRYFERNSRLYFDPIELEYNPLNRWGYLFDLGFRQQGGGKCQAL